ncbi:MAG: hypothetical protein CVV51_01985 [Spirochaetae bacterium HGW-Spirochaetae-7]|jgi:hypothetical protein|nr:MAG: hypothetical protein CVV51_01985 [Spirochaetae bacterium HGW-Spirochaetae-7]
MPQLFELVIVAFLAVIAIELLLIHRDLASRQGGGVPYKDEVPGQTINVNVGTPAGPAGPAISVAHEQDGRKGEAPEVATGPVADTATQVLESEPPQDLVPARLSASQSVRSTSSGLIAKKCPSCGMENSSYRSECFNCGGAL